MEFVSSMKLMFFSLVVEGISKLLISGTLYYQFRVDCSVSYQIQCRIQSLIQYETVSELFTS